MMAFGELYARGGRGGGKQVVPADWIEASLVPRGRSSRSGLSYGYGWWIRELGGVDAYFAWGYGGQFIFVVPQLELVVVTTSSPEPGADRRGHLEAVYQLVENLVIRPIAEATVLRVWLQSHA
jgi:CubicO group peptidase (beta-lactamase class C family)